MGLYPRLLSKEEQLKRDERIVYLRDVDHVKNGGEPLTWKAISERFDLNTEAVRKSYFRSKQK